MYMKDLIDLIEIKYLIPVVVVISFRLPNELGQGCPSCVPGGPPTVLLASFPYISISRKHQ